MLGKLYDVKMLSKYTLGKYLLGKGNYQADAIVKQILILGKY